MKTLTAILSLLALAPAAWAQAQTTTTKPETNPEPKATIPEHGTAIATAGTRSTAITSEVLLRRRGQASGEEAKALLVQYHAQEEELFQQREAAYEEMQGKTDGEKRQIWGAMIEAQKKPMAEHRALGARLAAARKAENEKAVAAEVVARSIKAGSTEAR